MKLPVKVKSIDLQVAGQAINTNAGRWEDFSHVYSGDYDYLQRHADGLNARADYRGIVVQALVHLEGITIVSDADLRALRSANWTFIVDSPDVVDLRHEIKELKGHIGQLQAERASLVSIMRNKAADLLEGAEEFLDD